MQVLTFGVQVAEVAVDVETGEVWVDRIAAIHDVGRVINPLGASSQVEGGIIQGIGHTLSEERLHDPRTGQILTTSLDAYKLPTIADVPGDHQRAGRRARRASDEPRLEGARRAADHPDRRGDRQRDPRRDRRRRPLAADHARGDAARAARGAQQRTEGEGWSSGGRLASTSSTAGLPVARRHRGRAAAARPARRGRRRSSTSAASCRAGSTGDRIGAGATLAELECDPQVPDALREACRLAASPQLRNMGSLAGNLLQETRCWYWRLDWPCRLHGGDECFAHEGEHREHAIFANDFCASAHPSDVAAALLALDATLRTTGASCRSPSSTGCRPRTTGARRRSSRAS